MPELPEVEYTARQLRASVLGATISNTLVFWERAIGHPDLPTFLAQIANQRITSVRRRGKYLILDLTPANEEPQKEPQYPDFFLTIHRRMTGNLLLLPPGWHIDTSLQQTDPLAWNTKGPTFWQNSPSASSNLPATTRPITSTETSYCRLCFNLSDGRRLLYTDLRKFGRIELWPRENEHQAFAELGPEPLEKEFTVEQLSTALATRKNGIKQVLLAQKVIAGLGNIYADEALYYASIHPLRRANSLTPTELAQLHQGIITVLTHAIEHGGTSFSEYRDLWGEAGENYNHVRVYQQEGKPCPRCGTIIERIVIAQRSSHFCPTCQQLIGE